MIKKTLATALMLSCFSLSSPVFAGGLSDDMKALGKNYKAFNQAENPQAATAALNNPIKSRCLNCARVLHR